MKHNYLRDNERAKEAIKKEENFLKEEVIGKGADTAEPDDLANEQTNIEKTTEKK